MVSARLNATPEPLNTPVERNVERLERELSSTLGPFMDQLREQYPQFHDGIFRFVLESVDYHQDQALEMLRGLAQPVLIPSREEPSRPSSSASSVTLSDNWSMVLTSSDNEDEVSTPSQLSEDDHDSLFDAPAAVPTAVTARNEEQPPEPPAQPQAEPIIILDDATPEPEESPVLPQDADVDINLDEATVEMEDEGGQTYLLPLPLAITRLQSVFPFASRETIISLLEATSFNGDQVADLLIQMVPLDNVHEGIVTAEAAPLEPFNFPEATEAVATSQDNEGAGPQLVVSDTQITTQDDDRWCVISDDEEELEYASSSANSVELAPNEDIEMSEPEDDFYQADDVQEAPADGKPARQPELTVTQSQEAPELETPEPAPQSERVEEAPSPLLQLQAAFPEFGTDYLQSVLDSCNSHLETAYMNLVLISESGNEPPRGRVSSEQHDREIAQGISAQQDAHSQYSDDVLVQEPEFNPDWVFGPNNRLPSPPPRWNSRYGWSDVGRGAPELLDSSPDDASAATRDYTARLRHPAERQWIRKPGEDWEPTSRAFGSLLSQIKPRMTFDNSDGIAGPSTPRRSTVLPMTRGTDSGHNPAAFASASTSTSDPSAFSMAGYRL